jgi:hypothetical protein
MQPLQPGSQQGPDSGGRVSTTRRHPCVDTPQGELKFNARFAPLLEDGFGLIGGVLVNSPAAFLS